jgi:hypothetical protein
MSGPIIRKYGFANFEKIFGERELKHGVDSNASKPDAASAPADASKAGEATSGSEPPKTSSDDK